MAAVGRDAEDRPHLLLHQFLFLRKRVLCAALVEFGPPYGRYGDDG